MVQLEYQPDAAGQESYILCADCGTVISSANGAGLCVGCLRNTVDITEGIPKESSLNFCRGCERFLSPPNSWVTVQPESRELLAICLKKIARPLMKVRLIDASFIWTEPHSRRIKIKITIQKEVLAHTVLQQTFELTLVVQTGQCPACTRLAAKNTWKASVQVRQKVTHKRTFLWLEQLILKHNAHKDTVNIAEKRDGLDFFYTERNNAIRMCDFLASVVPIRIKASEQLISSDTHSNTSNYKFTYSVEIVSVCKDDLVCIPRNLARSWGNISPLTLCSRIGNTIHLLDPMTLQQTDVTAPVYWRQPFDSLCTVTDLVEFIVLDVEPSGPVRGKYVLADAQVTRSSYKGAGDDANDDGIYHTRTHLGAIIQPGDTVLGFHLTHTNFNSESFESLEQGRIPDVILVKKTYPNRRKKSKARNWKLRSIAKEAEDVAEGTVGRGALGRKGGVDARNVERDYELFLRDLEEDREMRSAINLYKAEAQEQAQAQEGEQGEQDEDEAMAGDKKSGSGMRGGKRRQGLAKQAAESAMDMDGDEQMGGEGEEDEEEEEDFPEIDMDELLEQFEEMGVAENEEPQFGWD
ncbi:nonsense-mediated mRNA decay protein 3 [Cryptococcus wingfieldii CBS 7118]|uniref:60S ribosomal export protein NMD3 n=1 Tax=Cryptococcus wingfieldii CBS 7118 TaxID=1295528 RepID=A0A1E3JMD6_9TREE|nr:nonsense-mediated mRNA decay protein 3 [Cryptococcus wingfieldii CBS 7118]ODO02025.1 nonsense-mediated mRNA decay protein 3 [Cryptococcus wingfieldii CBS 7118]